MDSSTKKAPKPQPRTANPRSQDRDSPQGKVYTAKTPNGPVQYTLVDSGSRPAPMNSKVQQQTPSAGMQDQGYSRGMPRSNSPAFANNPSPNSTISSPGMQDRGYSQRMFYAPGFTSPSHGTQNREHSQGMSYANSAGIVASRSHNFMSTGPGIPNREYPQGMPYTNFPGHVINRSHEFMINRSHEFMSTGPGMQNRDYLPGVPYTNFSGPVINRSRNFTMTNSEAPDQRDSRGIFPTPALTSTSYETQDRGFPQGMSHTSSPGFRSNRPPNFTLSSSCTQDRGYSSVDSLQFTSNRFPDFQSTIPQNTTYNASSLQQISMPINQRRRVGNASASTRDDRMATNSHLNKAFSTHGFNTTKILPPTQTLNLGKVFPQFFAPDPDSMDATKQKRTQGNSFRSSSEYSLSSEPSTSDMEVRDNLMPERVRAGQSTITSAAMNPNLARSTISSMSATPSAISQMTTSVVARSTSRLTRTAGPTNSTANANTPTHVQGTPRFAPSGPSHSNGMGRGGATTPFQTVARFDRPIASDSFEFRTPAQSHPYPIPHMSIPHLSTPLNKNPTQFTGGRRALDATNHMLRRENHSGPDQYLDPTMNIANVANINNREKCGPLPTSRNSDHTPPLIPNSHLTYELFPKFPIVSKIFPLAIANQEKSANKDRNSERPLFKWQPKTQFHAPSLSALFLKIRSIDSQVFVYDTSLTATSSEANLSPHHSCAPLGRPAPLPPRYTYEWLVNAMASLPSGLTFTQTHCTSQTFIPGK